MRTEQVTGLATLEVKMREALDKAAGGKDKPVQFKNPLPKLDLVRKSPEEIAQAKQEGSETRQWAKQAAADLDYITARVAEIRGDEDQMLVCQDELKALLAKEKEIRGVTKTEAVKELRHHTILRMIHGTDDQIFEQVEAMMDNLVVAGEYRYATPEEIDRFRREKKSLPGTVFLARNYVQLTPESAIHVEARKKAFAHKGKKIPAMKKRGKPDLIGLKKGQPGFYYVYSPALGKRPEGHLLLQVVDGRAIRIRVVDAIGAYSFLVRAARREIFYFWAIEGRISTPKNERLSQEDFNEALSLMKEIRKALEFCGGNETRKSADPTEGNAQLHTANGNQ